jgi:uncharacterized protein
MLFLLSPAKSLDFDTPAGDLPHTLPQFTARSRELIDVLKQQSPQQIAGLMDLSDSLAALNVARYQAWSPRATARNAKQAVLAFDGDVYDGLAARSLSADDLAWAQQHLRILSGLYGVLRPLACSLTGWRWAPRSPWAKRATSTSSGATRWRGTSIVNLQPMRPRWW